MKVMYSNMVYYIVDSKTFVQIMNLDVNFAAWCKFKYVWISSEIELQFENLKMWSQFRLLACVASVYL